MPGFRRSDILSTVIQNDTKALCSGFVEIAMVEYLSEHSCLTMGLESPVCHCIPQEEHN